MTYVDHAYRNRIIGASVARRLAVRGRVSKKRQRKKGTNAIVGVELGDILSAAHSGKTVSRGVPEIAIPASIRSQAAITRIITPARSSVCVRRRASYRF